MLVVILALAEAALLPGCGCAESVDTEEDIEIGGAEAAEALADGSVTQAECLPLCREYASLSGVENCEALPGTTGEDTADTGEDTATRLVLRCSGARRDLCR